MKKATTTPLEKPTVAPTPKETMYKATTTTPVKFNIDPSDPNANRVEVCIARNDEPMMLTIVAVQTFTLGGMYCVKQRLPSGKIRIRKFPIANIRDVTETLVCS